jgi:hypothetical protein
MLKKNLVKIGTGLAAVASSFYWGALPALATSHVSGTGGETVSLCPTGTYNSLCTGLPNISTLIGTILSVILFIAFIAALVFLIIGGIKWIMSGGDKEGASKAKETVTSALIGLAIVLGAWILINIVLNFFGFTGGITALPVPKIK